MGAVPRTPFPRYVYSPMGGWWSQPKNWKSNTAVVAGGLVLITSLIWKFSNDKQ
ncbi:hypothetical protein BCR44DRAFT_1375059, partial [Catenaria anguillulae PL171]